MSAAAVDVTSTFTSNSGYEQNPAIAFLQPSLSLRQTVAVGAGLEVAAVWATCRLLCAKRPKLARTLAYIGAGAHIAAATDNWRRGARRLKQ